MNANIVRTLNRTQNKKAVSLKHAKFKLLPLLDKEMEKFKVVIENVIKKEIKEFVEQELARFQKENPNKQFEILDNDVCVFHEFVATNKPDSWGIIYNSTRYHNKTIDDVVDILTENIKLDYITDLAKLV